MEILAAMHNGSFIKDGPGQLEFSGGATNTYTGMTTVSSGTLLLARTASANASIAGNLTVGDTGTVRDVLRTASNEQIANASIVTINRSGWFDIIGSSETIGALSMSGGSITTGLGTLAVNGNIAPQRQLHVHDRRAILTSAGPRARLRLERERPRSDSTSRRRFATAGMNRAGRRPAAAQRANAFSGGVTVNAGTLLIGHDSAAGSSTLTIANAAISADGSPRSLANAIHFAGPATIDGSIDLTLTGPINNDAGNSIFKRGSCRLTIAGAQNFPFASRWTCSTAH
jgi:autotransporter-associated beta strand protein